MTPTFLGKKLRKTGTPSGGGHQYVSHGARVSPSISNHGEWYAECTLRIPQYLHFCAFDASPQKALDACEAEAISAFRQLGAVLGYDVE